MRYVILLAMLAAMVASPAYSQVIEPTCADFLYARAAGLSLIGYDARIMVSLNDMGQPGNNSRFVWQEAVKVCSAYPGYTFKDAVTLIIRVYATSK